MPEIASTDSQRKRRSIAQIAVLSAGLLILIGISASSVYLLYSLRTDADQIAHTLEVQNQIFATLLHIRRAESAERGYLITSQPEFLTEFREAEAAIRPALEKLRKLIEVDLKALEKSLDLAGAPWTTGRLPEWKEK